MAAGERGVGFGDSAGSSWIDHHVAVKSLRMALNRGHDGCAVAGNASDEGSLGDAEFVQFVNPGIGELSGIFARNLPTEQRSQLIDRDTLLLC